ncbi:hypothetical protein BDF20DRAFT_830065 [Mycotypha africana]|uniref:uncharacterized protein n=1 Tax=Mycotypha africana TaxID=64632 RepID=UPI002301E4FA|nr:uncharacterized protein BDF20DRAFT_830065 [Mycotypha africana]KAI8967134.1 hypothetical protein BDF20DRAFT_830065 [Mycotypha africana]
MTQAFGLSLQRKYHVLSNNNNNSRKRKTGALYKRPLWISGFLIYTLSTLVGSTCTIGYLPIVILAPVGAMGLVFNAIFAKLILGDPFTRKTLLGTAWIALGAGLIAGFGTTPEAKHTLKDLMTLYKRPSFIIYFSVVEVFTIVGLGMTHLIEYILHSRQQSKWWWALQHPNIKTWLGISYGVFGANISSQAMLFAKSGLELLILTLFHGENQFIYPLTWVIVLALIFTALLQLYYLNRGVQLCDTIILVPLNFCSFNVSCLFNGLFYYNQWDSLGWWPLMAVLMGICVLIHGVLLISFHHSHQRQSIFLSDDDTDEEEHHRRDHTPFVKTSTHEEETAMLSPLLNEQEAGGGVVVEERDNEDTHLIDIRGQPGERG